MQIDDEMFTRSRESLEMLNARIARLAIGLGVKLDDQAELNALMALSTSAPVTHERRTAGGTGAAMHPTSTVERRFAHQREELRGLLVLRYQMGTASLNENGLTITRHIIEEAEEHLIRQGFKPGADGLKLETLFEAV